MKFWQLISIFKDEKALLEKELQTEWGKPYQKHYSELTEIITQKKRNILDCHISNEFLKQVCMKSNKILYYSTSKKTLFSYNSGFTNERFSILEAIELFNHDTIEETFEKTESTIPCCP